MNSPLNSKLSGANKALVVPLTSILGYVMRGFTSGDWADDGTAAQAIATLFITASVYFMPNRESDSDSKDSDAHQLKSEDHMEEPMIDEQLDR